jgi:RNA polymerase sigma-70 factor (ECF subfamily)
MSRIFSAYVKHEQPLKRLLGRYLTRPQDIEDMAQECFLRAFAAELRGEVRSPKAFLFRVARNTALHEVERKAHSATSSLEEHGGADALIDGASLEDGIDARRRLYEFSRALATMPPRCREVFVLRKLHGLKVREIAWRLNISVSGVEKHLAAGVLHCDRVFRERGCALETAPGARQEGAVSKARGDDEQQR